MKTEWPSVSKSPFKGALVSYMLVLLAPKFIEFIHHYWLRASEYVASNFPCAIFVS